MVIHPHARKRLMWWLLLFGVLAVVVVGVVLWKNSSSAVKVVQPLTASNSGSNVKTEPTEAFNKNQYSTNDPTSLWVVVNKGRILPSAFVPANLAVPQVDLSEAAASENMHLRQEAAAAIEKLVSAASGDGVRLMLVSGYRSYTVQQSVYSGYVSSQGKSYADATSAQPGHSEHQTGLAADLGATSRKCQLDACFGDTDEGKWLSSNAGEYGFAVRYQKDKNSLTGYDYEPWHLRYLGGDLAAQLNRTGQTLEQFFGLPAHANYPAQMYELKRGN